MKIDIPDTLYQSYAEILNARCPHYFGSVDENIQRLITWELRRLAAPGYGTDGLTGCKTNHQLRFDLTEAMSNYQGEPALLATKYLCIDIDDFRHFLDHHGFAEGDKVLVDIANQLMEKYTAADVYRFGGDEFVVNLGDRAYLPIKSSVGIQLKHSIVEVVVQTNRSRFYHLHSLIMLYIHRGVVESEEQGKRIVLKYPDGA